MQIKATMRYHFTPTKEATILKKETESVRKDAEKLESSYTADKTVKWYSCFDKLFAAGHSVSCL